VFVGHVVEGLSKVLQEKTKKGGGTDQNQGFFVHNVNLLGDQVRGQTGTGGNVGSLGGNRVTGKTIEKTALLLNLV
jgi:hypothetical protein